MNKVVIYTTVDCVACRTTKIRFDKLGIRYDVVEADEAVIKDLKDKGFAAFPVVTVDCGDGANWAWCGYRHDDIKRLAELFQ